MSWHAGYMRLGRALELARCRKILSDQVLEVNRDARRGVFTKLSEPWFSFWRGPGESLYERMSGFLISRMFSHESTSSPVPNAAQRRSGTYTLSMFEHLVL